MKNILGLLLSPILVPILIIYLILEKLYEFGGDVIESFEIVFHNIRNK